MRQLLPYLSKYRWRLILSIVFNLLTALFTIISIPFIIPFFQILFSVNISEFNPPTSLFDLEAGLSYYFGRLIAISDKTTALGFVCLVLIIIVLCRNLFRYLSVYFLTPVRNGIVRDIRQQLVQSFLKMPLRQHRKVSKGELLSVSSNDVVEVEWSVIRMMELLFKSPLLIAGSLLIMFWINLELSVIALGLMIVVGLIMGGLSRNLKAKSAKTQSLLGILNNRVDGLLSGIKMIKAFGAESFFDQKFSDLNDDHYKKNNKILRRRDLASPLSEFLGVTLVVILVWFGAKMVIASEMRPETFFAFIFAFYNVIEPSKSLSTAYYNVQKGLAAMDRIQDTIQLSSAELLSSGSKSVPKQWAKISLREVSFSYDNQEVLREVNLDIQKGKSMAIVGKSGEGKSTILNLILRLEDPEYGALMIDNQDVKDVELKEYRSLYSYLSQEPILFEGDVKENLTFGNDFNDRQIEKALNQSNSDEFLKEKDENTFLSENGSNYSMGQRQRLAIARAIAQDREILVIDEATTALDAESEHLVLAALESAMKEKTTIMVSHRFSIIKNVDVIYVMDGGKIVNSGTHDELVSSDLLYKELLSYQKDL